LSVRPCLEALLEAQKVEGAGGDSGSSRRVAEMDADADELRRRLKKSVAELAATFRSVRTHDMVGWYAIDPGLTALGSSQHI